MRKVKFIKMVASGNDFVVTEPRTKSQELKNLAINICARKFGVGADGLLILEKSKVADVRMRIFNPDGSEAQMCGNGARCVALWLSAKRQSRQSAKQNIETKAGIIETELNGENVKIKFTDPKDIKLDICLKINNRSLKVNFINTGVPHTVIFVEGLDEIDVFNIGREIRNHKKFRPAGTNVDFVEVLNNHAIKIRTYERGVEDETLACGTGAVGSALITNYELRFTSYEKINVHTKSGEILKVYFQKIKNKFTDVWLEGKARAVYSGVYNV
jgi:diaminopimelate epimerase